MSKEQGSESAVSGSQFVKEEEMAEEKEAPRKISRREFVKGAAVGGAGVAAAGVLASCAPAATPAPAATAAPAPTCPPAGECAPCPVPGVPETWDRETDVVIVGSGGAGLAAAIEAGDAGAEVIVLEKTPVIGGDTVLSGGLLAGYETFLAKQKGIHVTAEEIYEWIIESPTISGAIDPEVARVNAERCGETIDWLHSLGVPFRDFVGPDPNYTPLPVMHWTEGGGAAFSQPLLAAAQEGGAEILLDTRATSFIADSSGRVIGVTAESNGETIHIKSRKAAVLCTGGYAANLEMMAIFNPALSGLMYVCSPGSVGDGLQMAMDRGCITLRNSFAPLLFPTVDVDTKRIIMYDAIKHGGVLLSEDGERFCNEDLLTYQDLPYAILKQARQQEKPFVWMLMMYSDELQKGSIDIYNPTLAIADTIEDLAEEVGLDPNKVKPTVDHYNELCQTGEDVDFGRMSEYLIPIDTPPFYGATVNVASLLTYGGLKIDTNSRVLRFSGVGEEDDVTEVIPGLYAAGQIAEWNVAVGWTLNCTFLMGRIAGQNAAAETAWE